MYYLDEHWRHWRTKRSRLILDKFTNTSLQFYKQPFTQIEHWKKKLEHQIWTHLELPWRRNIDLNGFEVQKSNWWRRKNHIMVEMTDFPIIHSHYVWMSLIELYPISYACQPVSLSPSPALKRKFNKSQPFKIFTKLHIICNKW